MLNYIQTFEKLVRTWTKSEIHSNSRGSLPVRKKIEQAQIFDVARIGESMFSSFLSGSKICSQNLILLKHSFSFYHTIFKKNIFGDYAHGFLNNFWRTVTGIILMFKKIFKDFSGIILIFEDSFQGLSELFIILYF